MNKSIRVTIRIDPDSLRIIEKLPGNMSQSVRLALELADASPTLAGKRKVKTAHEAICELRERTPEVTSTL